MFFDFSQIVINKDLRFSGNLTERRFELVRENRNKVFSIELPFILLPTEIDLILKKRRCKRNLVRPCGSSDSKVIFTWLTEVIILHVRPSVIDVKRSGFQLVSQFFFFWMLDSREPIE